MDTHKQFNNLVATGLSPEAAEAIIQVALEFKAASSSKPTPDEPSRISSKLYNIPASKGDVEALQQIIKLQMTELHWKLVIYLGMLAIMFLVAASFIRR